MRLYKDFLLPTGLLSGTIIGAGVFALPYIFIRSGLSTGFFYLGLGAVIYSFIHLFYTDLVLRTPGEHRFVGYAELYLGRWAFWLAIAMSVLEMIFVMTIYLVLSASFINLVAAGGEMLTKVIVFWVLGSAAVFLSIRKMAFVEFLIAWGMIGIIVAIFLFSADKLGAVAANGSYLDFANLLLPLGPILFALGGRVAIPSLVKYFRIPGVNHHHRLLRRAIIFGTVIPALVYGLFVLGILGLSEDVAPDSVSGLIGKVPEEFLLALGILGILALWSSYIIIGADVNNVLRFDLKFSKATRLFAVIGGPLLLYFLSSQDFIRLVSFVGGIFLALEGIFVVFMWHKLNRRAEKKSDVIGRGAGWGIALIMAVMLAALINEVTSFFK